MPQLSVVIVNYNVSYFLEQCLYSVTKAGERIDCEILVVDNNSVDGSVAMVKTKFPNVQLIANCENTGFSRANNQAIKRAKGTYILLLNPDTLVEEDTFEKSLAFMDSHPEAGGLGVKMIDGRGQFLPESKRGLPTPAVAFYKIFGLSALFPKSKTFGQYHLGYLHKEEIHAVPVLSGAFMLMRSETLTKTGLLDEAFFMYGEDIDLSYRITQAGYTNYYFPETRIIHYKGESTKKSSINYVFVFYRAMSIFAKKHFSARLATSFSILINLAIYLRAAMALANRFFQKSALPFVDAMLVWSMLLFIKIHYERYADVEYSDTLVHIAFLIYTLIWMLSILLNGGYHKPVSIYKIFRGILIGTLTILVLYALLPEGLRFSRALILLGTLSTALVYLSTRGLLHALKLKGYRLGRGASQKMGIVAKETEYLRIMTLLLDSGYGKEGIFRISPADDENTSDTRAERLQEIVEVYNVNTIVFSGLDVASHKIIGLMAGMNMRRLDFKIAPPESFHIIGSNRVDRGGDMFMLNLNVINSTKNRRQKRVFDIVIAILLVLSLPITIWLVKNKSGLLANVANVILGAKSWVGYAPNHRPSQKLPAIKQAVLTPLDKLKRVNDPLLAARKLNTIYARDYHIGSDLAIVLAGFHNLGRTAPGGMITNGEY